MEYRGRLEHGTSLSNRHRPRPFIPAGKAKMNYRTEGWK